MEKIITVATEKIVVEATSDYDYFRPTGLARVTINGHAYELKVGSGKVHWYIDGVEYLGTEWYRLFKADTILLAGPVLSPYHLVYSISDAVNGVLCPLHNWTGRTVMY